MLPHRDFSQELANTLSLDEMDDVKLGPQLLLDLFEPFESQLPLLVAMCVVHTAATE